MKKQEAKVHGAEMRILRWMWEVTGKARTRNQHIVENLQVALIQWEKKQGMSFEKVQGLANTHSMPKTQGLCIMYGKATGLRNEKGETGKDE